MKEVVDPERIHVRQQWKLLNVPSQQEVIVSQMT